MALNIDQDINFVRLLQTATDAPVTHPASSVKLLGEPKKLESCYRELLDNISGCTS